MIPYDDLVAALSTWRARQGLPVAAGSGSGPTAAPINPPASGPVATSGPARTAPPSAPPRGTGSYTPPPLETAEPEAMPEGMPETMPETMEDSLDVDDAALLEEAHYENEGGDFAMNFPPPVQDDAVEHDGESTTMGHAPEPPRDSFGGETDFDPKSRKPW